MALPTRAYGLSSKLESWLPLLTQVRYSRYKPAYVPPVVDRQSYEDGSLPLDISTPVKAAVGDITSAFTYDPLVHKFVNVMNKKGQKETVSKIMEKTFEIIKSKQVEKYNKASEMDKSSLETNPRVIFTKAIENCKPSLGLVTIKRGGKNYQVPSPLKDNRRRFLAMKWIIQECEKKPLKMHMPEKLAQELLDAFHNQGNVVKRKHDLHRQCEANRAYAHFRWW
ncbi:28S ribosomal protein S7, mitochondrial-like [Lytechinus variegatus]|uniref:28S ribosomal protein S7, mitochondrial-like n=1 Tax=Lytechinus variegatus TaxID=7654 RepID=UPI001BB1F09F|nr:28S ribosomal protein S7, mitochondrial-like [Lytechinus variegatus]